MRSNNALYNAKKLSPRHDETPILNEYFSINLIKHLKKAQNE